MRRVRISFCKLKHNEKISFCRVLLFKKDATAREINIKVFEYIIHMYSKKFKIPEDVESKDIPGIFDKVKKKLRTTEFF